MKYTECCYPTQDGIFDTVLTDRCYSSGGGGQGGLICLSVTLSNVVLCPCDSVNWYKGMGASAFRQYWVSVEVEYGNNFKVSSKGPDAPLLGVHVPSCCPHNAEDRAATVD